MRRRSIRDIQRARAAADPRRRHRLLLPRADARAVSRARRATRRCARGSSAIADRARRRARCTGCCARVDPASAARIQPRDRKRLVRALEVYFLTGRPLTAHFADTVSPIAGVRRRRRSRCGCRRRDRRRASRARVDAAVRAGLLDEIRALLARGVPGIGAPVRRARLPAGARAPARRARRGGDARAHRAGEPPLRAAPVDLVPQRA